MSAIIQDWQSRIPSGTDYGSVDHINAMKAEIADLRAALAIAQGGGIGEKKPILYVRQMDLDDARARTVVCGKHLDNDAWTVPLYTAPPPQPDSKRDACSKELDDAWNALLAVHLTEVFGLPLDKAIAQEHECLIVQIRALQAHLDNASEKLRGAHPESGRDAALSVAVAVNDLGATVVVSRHSGDVQTVLYSETHYTGYEGVAVIKLKAMAAQQGEKGGA